MPSFYGAIDLQKNELRQAQVQNLASAPSSPVTGQLWYDSANNILKWWNGSGWVNAQGGAGAVPATTVTTAAIGDAGVVGVATTYSREDHKHGMPAFGAPTAETSFGTGSSAGVAVTLARSDHTHGNPSLTSAAPSTQAIGDAAAVGSGTLPAREDHKHAMPAFGAISAETVFGSATNNGAAVTLARSDHTHGNPTHTFADHSSYRLDQWAVPTASVNLNNQKITNLLDPTNAQDGATKNYVDNTVQGLDAKASVHAATTANIANLASAAPNILDGVTLAANDRVLVKDQTTAAQNGIYTVTTLGTGANGVWARATDADTWVELPSSYVWVEQGTVWADTGWVCSVDTGGTLGTTSITWVQFAAAGAAIAGAGLTKTGNTFDVVAGDTSLTVAADSVVVNTAVIATVTSVNNAVAGMVKKYAATLTGTVSPETVTHSLNTRDVQVTVLNGASPYTAVEVDWDATTVNSVTVRYSPTLGAGYRVVVTG